VNELSKNVYFRVFAFKIIIPVLIFLALFQAFSENF